MAIDSPVQQAVVVVDRQTRLALRPRETAAALGVSPRTLWAWTAAGEIPHIRRGKAILYPVAALEQWLAAQAEGGLNRG
jgi:excisionase family DNA binding protein